MGRVAPPKCLFYAATQTKNRYTLIEQSVHSLVKIAFTNTTQLYN